MSVVDGGSSNNLVQRVQDILLRPKPTWDVIDGEAATVQGLYTGYAMILAALPAVASLLGKLLLAPMFGHMAAFSSAGLIVGALVQYVLALAGIYIFALVVDALASSFDGTKNQIQAFKAVIYGATASWVGGALVFIPVIGWLIALTGGLYSLYLFYLGLPKLMKVPEGRALGFVILSIVVALVIQVGIGMVAGAVVLAAGLGAVGGAALVT
jgi:hypothetical protein